MLYYNSAVREADAKLYLACARLLCELFPGPREQALAPSLCNNNNNNLC